MALCEVRFKSVSLQKQDAMYVVVPDGRGPFPVLYLLHGLSDDYTVWQRQTSIERYADKYRLMVVMPDTHRFFYVNDPRPGGQAYEDHVVKDVIGQADRLFPTIRSRRGRAVAGLSMGGFGAMMLALKHPDVFAAAVSHSGAFYFAHGSTRGRPDIDSLAGALPRGKYDVFKLARAAAKLRTRPAVRFDCGQSDFLIDQNREFHAHLDKIGYAHEYAEHPGQHTWDYWDLHVQETLRFAWKNLARK
jgi:S-formylglutathione hydrolase FrmB